MLLHRIFQRHHITPDEIYAKPRSVRHLIYASELTIVEDEEKARKEAATNR